MLIYVNFLSLPIHVSRLWRCPQSWRCNGSKFQKSSNDFGNLDEEEQMLVLNRTRLCSSPKSFASSFTPELDMPMYINFLSPPINVGRLWSSQSRGCNVLNLDMAPNAYGDLDKEKKWLLLNFTRLCSSPISSGSSSTPEFNMPMYANFLSPPIDLGRCWSWPHP